jgi:hypothetical protein
LQIFGAEFSLGLVRRSLLILAALCLSACDGPTASIANRSCVALENVVVSGSGFSIPVGHLSIGEVRLLTMNPHGESGVRVSFDGPGQHYDSGEQGYFEGGNAYKMSIGVDSDLTVTVDSILK